MSGEEIIGGGRVNGEVPEIRASDRDREATLERLSLAVSDGQLTLEEYSERVDVVLGSRTQNELARITNDLQQTHPPTPSTDLAPQSVSAIFGSSGRRGRWRVPERFRASAVFGEVTLEFQSAMLTAHRTVIEANATFGSVSIIVPEGVEVDLTGSAIFGSKESKVNSVPTPGAPVIEIRARALFGEVSVKHPDPKLRHQIRDAIQRQLES